jgi:uncharacterized membrane protein YdfJ with MMPL/SSD domain
VNRLTGTVLPRATRGTGIHAYLTGPNAGNVTFANLTGQRLPWLVAIVVLVSMLLLMVVFRSVTVAVKAAVMNLLSRIREHYDATGDNSGSVARGLASTARVISAAAAIMIVVFLSFVLGANVSVKQVGLGLAVAVLIDATLVRLVLVPAVMELLGKANWWLPAWLARLLPARSDAAVSEIKPPAMDSDAVPAAYR